MRFLGRSGGFPFFLAAPKREEAFAPLTGEMRNAAAEIEGTRLGVKALAIHCAGQALVSREIERI